MHSLDPVRAPALLLVTGARALLDTEPSEVWMKSLLETQISCLPLTAMVLHGGAVGPDSYAAIVASRRGLLSVSMAPSGMFVADKGGVADISRWSPHPVHPLTRNQALVDYAARAQETGAIVRVLGLHAPWSRTQGTAHTLRLAREAGLDVDSFSYSAAEKS